MRTPYFITRRLWLLCLLALIIPTINSCHRPNAGAEPDSFDNSEMVTATIYGFIQDENENALPDAEVRCGGNTTKTSQGGFFIFRNISTPRKATSVVVKHSGFFNGSRTIVVKKGHVLKADMIMMPLGTAQTFNASGGGSVQFNNLTIQFSANSIEDVVTGNSYNGPVNVYARTLDPGDTHSTLTMPGDLRGLTKDDHVEKKLASYGMFVVEMRDPAGNLLQIKPSASAHVKYNLTSQLLSSAQPTIPLWYFDESNGMWMEEGSAELMGGSYEGDVGHFSFWNLDAIYNPIYFEATFVDQNNQPLAGYFVIIYNASLNAISKGFTDNSGWVGGLVYSNANLEVRLAPYNPSCNYQMLYYQNITTNSVNYSMGTVMVNLTSNLTCNLTGTVVDCNSNPVPNTYVFIDPMGIYIPTNNIGQFSYYLGCVPLKKVTVAYFDSINAQMGFIAKFLYPGLNNMGYLPACGTFVTNIHLDTYFTGDGGYPLYGGASIDIDYANADILFSAGGNFDLILNTQDTTVGTHPVTGAILHHYDPTSPIDTFHNLDSSMSSTITYTNFPNSPIHCLDGTLDIWVKGATSGIPQHVTGTFHALRSN